MLCPRYSTRMYLSSALNVFVESCSTKLFKRKLIIKKKNKKKKERERRFIQPWRLKERTGNELETLVNVGRDDHGCRAQGLDSGHLVLESPADETGVVIRVEHLVVVDRPRIGALWRLAR